MAGEIIILVPKVTAAEITPNPVNINQSCKVSVTVTEESKVLTPYYYYLGDLHLGEV